MKLPKKIDLNDLDTKILVPLEIQNLLGKDYKLWSEDFEIAAKKFAKYNLDSKLILEKFRLYNSAFETATTDDDKALYSAMAHQLYFEALEYFFVLFRSFDFSYFSIPVTLSKFSTPEITDYAEKLIKDIVTDLEADIPEITLPFYGKSRKITGIIDFGVDEDILFWPFYVSVYHMLYDFTDKQHRNVYNSMKHGNRGRPSQGSIKYKTPTGKDESVLLDRHYTYTHSRVESIEGLKQDLYISQMNTFIKHSHIFMRTKICINLIGFMEFIYKFLLTEDFKIGELEYLNLEYVREAWEGENTLVSIKYDEIASFKKDAAGLTAIAQVCTSISLHRPLRFGPNNT